MPLPLAPHQQLWAVIQILSIYLWLDPPPVHFLTFWKGFNFLPGKKIMRSTIPLLRIDHTLECGHGFLHAPQQIMELDSLVALVFLDHIVVLSDVI